MFGNTKKTKLDPVVAKYFKKRRGYANFYFNEVKQEEIWQRLTKPVAQADKDMGWLIRGKINKKPFELLIANEIVRGRVNDVFEELDFDKDLSTQRLPRKSGGLLLALHQWRRFLLQGPKKYGDMYYLGTAPLYRLGNYLSLIHI